MSVFDLNPVQGANIYDQALQNPLHPDDLAPSWYSGAWKAPLGVGMLATDAGLLAADSAAPMLKPMARSIDELFGTSAQEYVDQLPALALRAALANRPDPRTTGWLGSVGFNLFGIVPEVALTRGTEVPAILQGYKAARFAMAESNVDPLTAYGGGLIEGLSVYAGMRLPIAMGASLPLYANVGFSVGSNMALGAGTRGILSSYYEARGYNDLAQQYRVLDGQAMLIDAVMGTGFGLFGHAMARRELAMNAKLKDAAPSDVDAALAANNNLHAEVDTLPGLPRDFAAADAHTKALNKALVDLMSDEPVVAPEKVTQAEFIDKPVTDLRKQADAAIEDHLGPEWNKIKAELERRGLSTDELDMTGPARQLAAANDVTNAKIGADTEVKIEGKYVPARWAIVDAKDVEATMAKAPNQFRDRTRAASLAQIEKISNDPDFKQLGEAPLMDFGAPTLTRDGLIIGGNGRFAGVAKSYGKGKGEQYRKPLRESLSRFGLTEADLAGKDRPVLVRILSEDVDVQRAAIASNEGAGMRMSALEQAKVDALRLGDIAELTVGDTGEVNNAANVGIIRQWMAQFPDTEQAAMVDKAGLLSQEGQTRLRNALLFRAYGDSPTLARLVESTDPGARNVATALVKTAPMVAEVKDGIAAGELYPLDISEDITGAVEKLDAIRSKGGKIADYLNQGQMFGDDISPIARQLLEFFGENLRSSKAISEGIAGYYERVKEAGNPQQADIFGSEPPTREALLEAAIKDTGKFNPSGMAELPFGASPELEMGEALKQRIKDDFPALVEEYNKLPDTEGGRVLNTDDARELSPEYRADRSKSAAVHDAAGDFVEALYAKKLAGPTPEGLNREVLILGGGGGSGKSTGRHKLEADGKSEIVYDTTIANFDTATQKIEAALKARRKAIVSFTARDPIEAFYGALARSMRQENEQGSGRTVPLKSFAKQHPAARENIDKLAIKYADNPNVDMIGIDNSHGPGNAKIVSVAEIPTFDYNGLEAKLYDILQEEFAAGRISEAVYTGTLGDYRPEQSGGETGAGDGRQPEPQRPSPRSGTGGEPATPTQAAVDQTLADTPDLIVADEQGRPVPASQLLADADAEIARAQKDAAGFDAAVACALRG